MLKGKDHCTDYMSLQLAALLTDRGSGFEAQCKLTPTSILYTDRIRKILEDFTDVRWSEDEFSPVRPDTAKFLRAF